MEFSKGGEGRLLTWLAEKFGPASERGGVGDDAAILPFGDSYLAVTTDAVVEGVHFRRDWFTWAEIGRRATYACLSDLAAMAAEPLACFLSIGVPPDLSDEDVHEFIAAVDAAGREFDARLSGGDTVASPTFFADLIAVGKAWNPILRRGGMPGDLLCVTGGLGCPAASVALLNAGRTEECFSWPWMRKRLVEHRPRVLEAVDLIVDHPHAMMDISDGLMLDASRLAAASECLAVIEAESLPLDVGVEDAAGVLGRDPLEFAAGGGEEYELLFAIEPDDLNGAKVTLRQFDCPLTVVGWLQEGEGAVLIDAQEGPIELPSTGWEHYKSSE
jgi:thiamine-monophosphate kinase